MLYKLYNSVELPKAEKENLARGSSARCRSDLDDTGYHRVTLLRSRWHGATLRNATQISTKEEVVHADLGLGLVVCIDVQGERR